MKIVNKIAIAVAFVASAGCATTTRTGVGTSGSVQVPTQPAQVSGSERGVIPVGQEIDVRLQTPLSSKTATVEQRFETTTVVDLKQGDTILVPAGSIIRGIVSKVEPAGKIDRTGRLTLSFDRLQISSRSYPIRAMATQVFESGGIREEAGTVGTAGAVGAIVGGIIGGLKGAIIGAAVGSGGVIAATEGSDVELPAGSIMRIRMDAPVQIR